MYDLYFRYEENVVDVATLTQHKFPTFFQGSELLILGRCVSERESIATVITRTQPLIYTEKKIEKN